ncbi:MAG: hypothetical protein JWL81_1321 [Verrucomicrobiales bacterium]|nr:hypothetical protein [Verrucomicrobiales bacterium]
MIPLLQSPENRLLLLLVTTEPAVLGIAFSIIVGKRAGKVLLLSSLWSLLSGVFVLWKATNAPGGLVSFDLFFAPLLGTFALMAWLVQKHQPDHE